MFRYKAVEAKQQTSTIFEVWLQAVDEPLPYKAGQYIDVHLPNKQIHPLSIANAPTKDGRLQFIVRQDKLKLADKLMAEDSLLLSSAKGNMKLVDDNKAIIFIAGGTGIAPIQALIEALKKERREDFCLYWGISRLEDAQFARKWQAQYGINGHLVLSSNEQPWNGPKGLIHVYCQEQEEPSLIGKRVYASGPYELVQCLKKTMAPLLEANHFFSDL